MDLKKLLMELGNRLVQDWNFMPAVTPHTKEAPSTQPIDDFVRYLNEREEAQIILAELGVTYPVVGKQVYVQEGGTCFKRGCDQPATHKGFIGEQVTLACVDHIPIFAKALPSDAPGAWKRIPPRRAQS